MKKICAILFALSLLLTGCASTPAPEPEGPIRLTLSGINLIGSPIEGTVKEFNKSQDEIIVELKDYMQETEDQDQAITRFHTEVLSGNPPDLYYFPMLDFMGETMTINIMSPLPFLSNGFLMDLDPFAEADSDLKPEDFLIWKALHQYGGMYLLSNSFNIQTVSCTPNLLKQHQNWTIDEYMEIEAQLQPNQRMFTQMSPEKFIFNYSSRYMRDAMDLEHASCDFDNEIFLTILKDAMQMDTYEFEWNGIPAQQQVMEGTTMAGNRHLYAPDDITFDRHQSGGTRMAYIGWPTPDGSNGTDIQLIGSMGISSKTDRPEACWQMVRYFLTHWSYGQFHGKTWGTPVYAPELETLKEEVKKNPSFYESMNQEDIDQFLELAAQSETLNFYDPTVMELIQEETEQMFKGYATPEETAKKIQARVSLYMQEKYG